MHPRQYGPSVEKSSFPGCSHTATFDLLWTVRSIPDPIPWPSAKNTLTSPSSPDIRSSGANKTRPRDHPRTADPGEMDRQVPGHGSRSATNDGSLAVVIPRGVGERDAKARFEKMPEPSEPFWKAEVLASLTESEANGYMLNLKLSLLRQGV